MLSEKAVREFAVKYQTSELNITREYFQHLFLSALYSQSHSEKLGFKGGTALRIIFNSPRFSEDLDFTADPGFKPFSMKRLLASTLERIGQDNLPITAIEEKETSEK